MADVLIFDPTDFEILETFDFEEDIRRPEETRFYTLDEQLTDYFEKTMPKRKATKFEIKELKQLRDRIKESYENLITVTETDYIIDKSRKSVNTSWIHPVYSDYKYKNFSYEKEWIPIFEKRRIPNYYDRLIKALPQPFVSTADGRPLDKTNMLLNEDGENPVNGLGNYVMTKTVVRDDGTYDVVTVEVPNTADDIKTKGFYLDSRLPLPHPLMEHPFLKSDKAGYIATDQSLVDSYPSITAILEHAVPATTDPYGEGMKYLKLYDIQISQIPWMAWKDRFRPVEHRDVPIPVRELPVTKEHSDKPGDILTKTYIIPWYQGYDSRLWLSKQVDGGYFVSKILLSDANNTGSLSVYPYFDSDQHPESKPEICMALTSTFDSFLDSGLYRKGQCIPVGTILQEKVTIAYRGRQVWGDTTKHDLLVNYQKLLKSFQSPVITEAVHYKKFEHNTQSERRQDVIAILEDVKREPEDKADAIEKLTRDLSLENNQYFDKDLFVLCSHTLGLLRGGLEDRFKFYSEWTVSLEGSRVCKYCGEQINRDTFVAVKEYDEDGHLTMDYSALPQDVVHADVFFNSIAEIKKMIDIENAGENILFTVMTFLQILPNELQLVPILQLIRKLSAALKGRAAAKPIGTESRELTEGILGLAGAVVLLQAHNPFLIPKRKTGNRPINTTGYPRDSDDPETCNTLNSILTVLRTTLESFPATYRGNVATVLRNILRNSKELKVDSLRWIKFFSEHFKPLFENARERYEVPAEDVSPNTIQLPIEVVDNPVYLPGETLEEEKLVLCKTSRTTVSWHTKRIPNLRQTEVPLQSKIEPSPNSSIVSVDNLVVKTVSTPDKEIRRRVAIGLTGFPGLNDFVKKADANSYIAMTSQILTVLSSMLPKKDQQKWRTLLVQIDTTESPSLVRDIAKGIFFELMASIKSSAPMVRMVTESFKSDLTMRMILISEDAARKEDFELRAVERNFLKAALRSMTDTEREITQRMLELGIADIIISNVDRERFAREFGWKEPEVEEVPDLNRPEEGYGDDRDYVENGDQPIADDGTQLEVDRGEYGDRAVRDYDDYTTQSGFYDDE